MRLIIKANTGESVYPWKTSIRELVIIELYTRANISAIKKRVWSSCFECEIQGQLARKNEQQISVSVIQIKDSRYVLLHFRYHNKDTAHSRVRTITFSFAHHYSTMQ